MINPRYMTDAQATLARRAMNAGIRVDDYEAPWAHTNKTRFPCIVLYNDHDKKPLYIIEAAPAGIRMQRRVTNYYQLIADKRFNVSRNVVEMWLSTKET